MVRGERARTRRRPPRALGRAQTRLPRVDVVFNPVSGSGGAARARAEIAHVLARGYDTVVFHETTPEVGAADLARAALAAGAAVLVASGGDGTVTAVAGALYEHVLARTPGQSVDDDAGSVQLQPAAVRPGGGDGVNGRSSRLLKWDTAETESKPGPALANTASSAGHESGESSEHPRLGVIPRGTANAFATALGIPVKVKRAAALINRAPARAVDIAMVNNEHPMLLLCGIGLEAETVKRADRKLKTRFGPLAYFFAGMSSVAQEQRFKVNMVLEDVHQRTRSRGLNRVELATKETRLTGVEVCALTIANAAPPASVLAQGAGDVLPDDGLLEVVCVTPAGGPMATVQTMLRLLRCALMHQTTVLHPGVTGLRARRVRVECDPPQRVVVDGEDAGMTPVVVELSGNAVERQISVVAPKAGAVTRRRRRLGRALVRSWRNIRGIVLLVGTVAVVRSLNRSRVAAAPRRLRL